MTNLTEWKLFFESQGLQLVEAPYSEAGIQSFNIEGALFRREYAQVEINFSLEGAFLGIRAYD